MVSQKQEEQVQIQQQVLPDESSESNVTSNAPIDAVDATPSTIPTTPLPPGKKRGKKKTREVREIVVNVKDISPKPSYWPLALAFSVSMLLAGTIVNDVLMWIGIVLVVVCVIGWSLERR